jgi:hypothetical protein
MDQATELAQTTAMATKVASTVMRVSGLARSVIFWHPDARRWVQLDDAALHSLTASPARSEPLDWDAPHHIWPTLHVGKLAARRAEARGHLTVDGRLTRDANGFPASSDHSSKRSESGRWS